MEKLGLGIIGLGAFGESHIQALRGIPHVEVVAVASRTAARAQSVAERYGISQWYEGYTRILDDPAVQAVTVVTAESDHRKPVVAALAAGKHVLVEKPMATTLEDARAMLRAAKSASGIFMPGHILRFETKYATLKEEIAAGNLGRLVSVAARRNRTRSLATRYDRVHPVLVTGIHDLDVMLWLTSDRVRRVRAIDRLAKRDDGIHGLWAILEFESGVVGTLETVWMLPDTAGIATDDAFEIVGTRGTAKLQFDTPELRLLHQDGFRIPDVSYEPRIQGKVGGALREELAYFTNCALNHTPPETVTPADGLRALAVARALIESAERDADVSVTWPEEQ